MSFSVVVVVLSALVGIGESIDNGVGLTPPMGWRHWKAFGADISQQIMENMMNELVTKYPVAGGEPTSLAELGYLYVGLDDHWQNCTTVCANGTVIPSWEYNGGGYINCDNTTGQKQFPWYSNGSDGTGLPYGTPIIDHHRFPDMKGMVSKAHSMGLRAGWYFGNYQCSGANHENGMKWDMDRLVAGSVNATVEYGFDSVKLDSGFSVGANLTLWAKLFNESGRPVMIENCHQGADAPGGIKDGSETHNCSGLTDISDCPFNFWRTTGDPYPDWGDVNRELNSLRKIVNPIYADSKRPGNPEFNANPPRSRPGGFAYPGTMVVGDGGSVKNGTLVGGMTKNENAVHFGGWCITSSPLILAYNLSEPARRELIWDMITNKEAIYVNQAWVGHPGSQAIANAGNNSWTEVWTKPLGNGRTAAFILNTADANHFNSEPYPSTERGHMSLMPCNASSPSQNWALSKGVLPTDANTTNLESETGGCIEITGCNTNQGAGVGTGFGCKSLPKNCDDVCDCNGAWRLNAMTGTIISVMDNSNSCLQYDSPAKPGASLDVDTCVPGLISQKFEFKPSTSKPGTYSIQQALGDYCIDNNYIPAPPSPTPNHGPAAPSTITIKLSDLNLGIQGKVKVRDVWNKVDLAEASDTFTTVVPYHGSIFVIFMPVGSAWPLPFELAPWMRSPAPPPPPHRHHSQETPQNNLNDEFESA